MIEAWLYENYNLKRSIEMFDVELTRFNHMSLLIKLMHAGVNYKLLYIFLLIFLGILKLSDPLYGINYTSIK